MLYRASYYSLRTTVQPTCVSRSHSAFSTSPCWWSPSPGHITWASFIGWSQTTMKWCVRRRHRTRRCTPSYQDSTVCHRAIMFAHLLRVRRSTTGRPHNSVNSSTTVRVLSTYNRTANTSRWQEPSFENRRNRTSKLTYILGSVVVDLLMLGSYLLP